MFLTNALYYCHGLTVQWLDGKEFASMQEVQETWVQSLGQEDPVEKEWLPSPVFLPRKSHGQRSLVGYSPWGFIRVGYDWSD